MKPLWQDSFLKTQADIYACSNYFFQGFFLFKLIWLHYGSVKAGTRFFPFLFSFFHPSIAWFLFYVLVFHFLSFCCMFYLELCSHFLFCIFVLAVHFLWLHLIMFSLASLDNVSLASLDKVSLATIGFFTSCQQSSLTLRTSFKTGAFFFGCDWFIDLASTRVFTIWNQLSNLRFLPSNWFFGFASKTTTLTGVQCK